MCDGHVTPRFGAYQLERSTSLPPYQDDNLTIIGDQNKCELPIPHEKVKW